MKRLRPLCANDILRRLTVDDLYDFEMRMAFGLDVPDSEETAPIVPKQPDNEMSR